MRLSVLIALATLITACGGGGGNPGQCLGSPAYCAEHAGGSSAGGGSDSGGGLSPAVFERSGVGDTVFKLPTSVTRIEIEASYEGSVSSFIVAIDGSPIVNTLIGEGRDSTTFRGTFSVPGDAEVAIVNSTGVQWSITELR